MVKNVRFNFVKRSLPVGNVKKAKPTQKITGDINLEFEVISNKVFDRNKSYYSVFFQSVIIFTDYKAKSYQILHKYDAETNERSYYICLYKDKVDNAIPLVRDYTGGYKIYTKDIFYDITQDINIDVKLVQERENPDCIIYKIR